MGNNKSQPWIDGGSEIGTQVDKMMKWARPFYLLLWMGKAMSSVIGNFSAGPISNCPTPKLTARSCRGKM